MKLQFPHGRDSLRADTLFTLPLTESLDLWLSEEFINGV